ncbi:MAG TPA: acyl-ACP thioesterase, partial [Algoriphagus sp.]|nr:acyl-ACP thioesterase [Algoriphagus sp.]
MSYPENFQFRKIFEINSFMVSPNGTLRVKSLAVLLQEIAWKHADSEDFGRNLMESQQMWAL